MDDDDPNRLGPPQPNLLNLYSNGDMGKAGLFQSRRQGVGYLVDALFDCSELARKDGLLQDG